MANELIDYYYITNPSNYPGTNPRGKYGEHTKGVYAPILIKWSEGFKIEVSNDGTNNNFVSYDIDGSVLYQGVLQDGFALSTENVDVSITNGNILFTLKSNSIHTITNTAPVKCFCKATENSCVRAVCSGGGKFQLLAQDSAIIVAEFDGGGDAMIDSSYPSSIYAKDTGYINLTLGGSFEATSASVVGATDSAVINMLMKDTSALHGGKNEGGAIEGYKNATINVTMQDDAEIVRTGNNQSYFAFNLSNYAHCNLKMKDNANINCGNTNAYAINMWGDDLDFVLTMEDNAKIQISKATANGRAITAKGGTFNITMKGDSVITCGGNGSSSCYALGGNKDSTFKVVLMDNATLTSGLTSGQGNKKNDIIAGFDNSTNSHFTIYDNRENADGREINYAVVNNQCSVNIEGAGKENTSYDIIVGSDKILVNNKDAGTSYTNKDLSIAIGGNLTITTNTSKQYTIVDTSKLKSTYTFNDGDITLTTTEPQTFAIATSGSANVTATVNGGNQGSGEYIKTSGASVANITLANFTHNGNDRIKSEGSSNLTLNLTGTTTFSNGGYRSSGGSIVNEGYVTAIGSSTLTLNMRDNSIIGEGNANGVIVGCLINNSASATLNVNMYNNAQIRANTSQSGALVAAVSNVTTGKVNIVMNGNSKIHSPSTSKPQVKDIIYNNGTMVCTLNDNAIIEATTGGSNRIANFRNEDTLTLTLNGASALNHPLNTAQSWTKNSCHISTTYRNTIRDNRTSPSITCLGVVSGYDSYVTANYSGADSSYFKRI